MKFPPLASIFALLAVLAVTGGNYAAAASELPSARDGYQNSAIYNGNQNMPVTLYGVAMTWEKNCLKGRADQCMRLGQALEEGEGDLKAEIRAALGFYLKACEKGNGTGCMRAASMIREGSANFTNAVLAQETAERGCKVLKDQDACAAMAMGLATGGRPMDNEQAAALIDNACAAGSDYGCHIKAMSLFYDRDDAASLQTAIRLFENACQESSAWGCTGLAEAYEKGRGVAMDGTRSRDAARKGCLDAEGNSIPACALYGRHLTQSGSSSDMKLGVKLLAKACLGRDAFACNDAGEIGLRRPGSGVARWEVPLYFRDGCDLDLADACLNLAGLYENGFDAVRTQNKVMMSLMDKGCRLGSSNACGRIKDMGAQAERLRARIPKIDPALPALQQLAMAGKEAEQGNRREALASVVRLMQEGVAEAQWLLGGWMYYGKPGLIDTPRQADGIILFENAARQGHVEAAKWIGMAYWYGDGVDLDREKGEGYMALAAADGDEMAGAILRSMKAEPIREATARRQKEMQEEAERRKNDWGYQLSLAMSAWSRANLGNASGAGMTQSGRMANASWQRSQQALDKLNWNNAIRYTTGKSSACPLSNPYCR